jgi:hypothetical protein
VKLEKSPHFLIDASATAKQFCHHMTNFGASGGKVFRPSATRLFLFYVLLGLPLLVCILLFQSRFAIDWSRFFSGRSFLVNSNIGFRWSDLLVGGGFVFPLAIIFSGIVSLFLPVRLTAEGIHAHSTWGLPRFIRWRDIKSVRKFSLPILTWLRLYDADGSSAVWLIMFQSAPAQFKQEIEKLAPPASPILNHLD